MIQLAKLALVMPAAMTIPLLGIRPVSAATSVQDAPTPLGVGVTPPARRLSGLHTVE